MKLQNLYSTSIAALPTALIGIGWISHLLYDGKIGEFTFAALFSIVCFVGLIIFGFSRLRELDFKNLKLTLSELKTVRDDLYAKTQDLQRIAIILIEITSMAALWLGRLGEEEDYNDRQKWFSVKTHELLEALNVSGKQQIYTMRFQTILQQLHDDTISQDERNRIWAKFTELVKEENQNPKDNKN